MKPAVRLYSMQIIPASPQALKEAVSTLKRGGIVAHATETCYGFACDLTNLEAVEKLFALKKRPADQPVSALFPSVEEAKKYVKWTDEAKELASRYLPGPLTLILPMRSDAPMVLLPTVPKPQVPSPKSSLGIRISSHSFAQKLAAAFDKPLSTTSANLHGQPNPYSAEEITNQFRSEKLQPDFVIDSGKLPPNPPSTVIDLTTGGTVRRKGMLKKMTRQKIDL